MAIKEDKQLLILQILFYCMGYVIFQNVILANLKKRVVSNENKIRQSQTEYLDGIKSVNSLEKSYREYYGLIYSRDYMVNKLISRGEERYLGETITNLSMENDIKLSNITFTDSTEGDTQKYVLKTDFNTNFYTLKEFLNSIDELEKNINLDNMVIKKRERDLDVSATFSIYMSK